MICETKNIILGAHAAPKSFIGTIVAPALTSETIRHLTKSGFWEDGLFISVLHNISLKCLSCFQIQSNLTMALQQV